MDAENLSYEDLLRHPDYLAFRRAIEQAERRLDAAPGPLTARNAHGGPVERPGFLFAHARIGLDLVLARLAPYDDADARLGGDT